MNYSMGRVLKVGASRLGFNLEARKNKFFGGKEADLAASASVIRNSHKAARD